MFARQVCLMPRCAAQPLLKRRPSNGLQTRLLPVPVYCALCSTDTEDERNSVLLSSRKIFEIWGIGLKCDFCVNCHFVYQADGLQMQLLLLDTCTHTRIYIYTSKHLHCCVLLQQLQFEVTAHSITHYSFSHFNFSWYSSSWNAHTHTHTQLPNSNLLPWPGYRQPKAKDMREFKDKCKIAIHILSAEDYLRASVSSWWQPFVTRCARPVAMLSIVLCKYHFRN